MRVVVTGALGDIGSAVVKHLAAQGHDVIQGTREVCDVTSLDSVRSFLGMAWGAEGFDALVTCHGAPGCIKASCDLTDEEFGRVLEIDLIGTFRVCREAARYMLARRKGAIVNVSSIHALAAYPERAAYAAAKAGVCGLTRALAVEWALRGITVNAVLPGQVFDTRRTDKVFCSRMIDRSPSGALVYPDDVAAAILMLLTSKGITGQCLAVDDGWTASGYFKSHT